jgi:hypothetical protein
MIKPFSGSDFHVTTCVGSGAPSRGTRRGALLVLAACLAVMAFGPLSSAQALPTASISGTVTSVKGAKELKGIEVTLKTEEGAFVASVVTNVKGEYKLTGLAKGGYTVTFTDPTETYLTREESLVLGEGEARVLNAKLKETGTITGTVSNAASVGLEGASVFVDGPGGSYDTSTGAAGHYSIKGVLPGSYEIVITDYAAGYLPQSTSRTVEEGPVVVSVALVEGAKISGTVTDAVTHAGLAKIAVYAYNATGGFGGAAVTNASGEYTITGLEGGSYKLGFFWEFSEAESKEFENAPREIPKYITQYYNGQLSLSSANPVAATAGATTAGINVAMVQSLPVNTAAPAVSGASTVGSPLSCSTGSWTGEPELTLSTGWPLTSPFGYQWLRNGVAVTGATSDTYVLQAADVGQGFVCEVTATNAAGKASAKSASFTVVPPVPVIKIATSKLSVSKNATKVSIACASAKCAGTVKTIETIVTKHKKGHKTVTKKEKLVLATGSYSLTAGQTGTVTLHLTSVGKSKLAKASSHRLSVKLVASLTGGKAIEKTVQLSLKS